MRKKTLFYSSFSSQIKKSKQIDLKLYDYDFNNKVIHITYGRLISHQVKSVSCIITSVYICRHRTDDHTQYTDVCSR